MDYLLEYKNLNDENHIYQCIDYDQLINYLDTFATGLFYVGGPWCQNCQAVVDIVNQLAKTAGLEVIYNYDPMFVNVFGEFEDLRDCKSLEIKLKYYAIVERLGYKSEELVKDTLIPRMHVPFFFAVKNGQIMGTYSIELERDGNSLHDSNSKDDKTIEFVQSILNLINKIKEN